MAYSEELKQSIKKRLEKEKVKEICKETGISLSTLYKWKKELSNAEKEDLNKTKETVETEEEKETSKQIKQLIKLKYFKEAYRLTLKYPNNAVIQSQKVTIYTEEGKYKKAKKIGEKFKEDAPIQSQMVTIYMREGEYEKAKEIGEKFKDNAPIQSQMVTIYMREGEYEKAKEIGGKFKEYAPIQSQMVTIYMREGEYEKAKEIGEKFKEYAPIQSQMVTIYMREGEYEKAKEIGEKFKEYAPIQSQMVSIYMKNGKYEKAKKIGKKFKEYAPIQSQMVTIYMREGEYEKAKEIGEKFKDNAPIQSQMVTIRNKELEKSMQVKNIYLAKNIHLANLRNQIYEKGDYNITEIKKEIGQEEKQIDEFTQILIELALNDKRKNDKEIKRIINKYIKEHPTEEEHIKQIKKVKLATQKKNRIFDKLLYDELIGWNKEIKSKQTIYETMNPKLQKQINEIINSGEENNEIQKIKKFINCNNNQKGAIMRLIFVTNKIGLDLSLYYPEEYKEYKKIRREIIKQKNKEKKVKEKLQKNSMPKEQTEEDIR